MPRATKILLLLAVIAGSVWLQYLIDDGLGIGWPQNAERNWEQFGLMKLHGQLVTNPGGYEAITRPNIYKGMSPVYLYPVYWVAEMFSWTGLGTLSFHILLALVVFWAVWRLLGRDYFALSIAAAVILCPGYGRWQKILDPNAISVLFGFPYIAIVVAILKNRRLGAAALIGMFVLTLLFTSLNWTSAWAFGPCMLLLLGLPQINRRAVASFIVVAGVSSFVFAVTLMMVKFSLGRSAVAGPGLLEVLRGYTWGNIGYGVGLTTGKAVLRLGFVNGVGLLPVLAAWGWLVVRKFQPGRRNFWFALSPFAITLLEVAFMRNYFGHHPWMSAPVLLLGLVLSMVLLRNTPERVVRTSGTGLGTRMVPATALFCFIYGLAVVAFLRANETNSLDLVSLIRLHTARSDCIVLVRSLDPQTARIASRFDEIFDRRVLVVDDLAQLPADGGRPIILSAVPAPEPGALVLLAHNSGAGADSGSWLRKTADWFNHNIARRRPGDRLELADSYYLYETKP